MALDLKKKYGPLPAWGWASIAGVAAFLYIRHRGAAQNTATTGTDTGATSPTDFSGVGGAVPAGGGGFFGGGGASFPQGFDTGNTQPAPSSDFGNVTTPSSSGGGTVPAVTAQKANTAPGYGLHTVAKGDTLAKLEATYGLTLADLRAYNPNFNFGSSLQAGEVLRVRSSAPSVSVSQAAGPNGVPLGTTTGTTPARSYVVAPPTGNTGAIVRPVLPPRTSTVTR